MMEIIQVVSYYCTIKVILLPGFNNVRAKRRGIFLTAKTILRCEFIQNLLGIKERAHPKPPA